MKKLILILAVLAVAPSVFADLASDYALISNAPFKQRVTMAVLKAARDVKAESSGTTNHAERLAWANSLIDLGVADAMAGRFLVNVVANSTISSAFGAEQDQTDVTDNDIQFVVNGLVDQYALALFPQEE